MAWYWIVLMVIAYIAGMIWTGKRLDVYCEKDDVIDDIAVGFLLAFWPWTLAFTFIFDMDD